MSSGWTFLHVPLEGNPDALVQQLPPPPLCYVAQKPPSPRRRHLSNTGSRFRPLKTQEAFLLAASYLHWTRFCVLKLLDYSFHLLTFSRSCSAHIQQGSSSSPEETGVLRPPGHSSGAPERVTGVFSNCHFHINHIANARMSELRVDGEHQLESTDTFM